MSKPTKAKKIKAVKAWAVIAYETNRIVNVFYTKKEAMDYCHDCDKVVRITVTFHKYHYPI